MLWVRAGQARRRRRSLVSNHPSPSIRNNQRPVKGRWLLLSCRAPPSSGAQMWPCIPNNRRARSCWGWGEGWDQMKRMRTSGFVQGLMDFFVCVISHSWSLLFSTGEMLMSHLTTHTRTRGHTQLIEWGSEKERISYNNYNLTSGRMMGRREMLPEHMDTCPWVIEKNHLGWRVPLRNWTWNVLKENVSPLIQEGFFSSNRWCGVQQIYTVGGTKKYMWVIIMHIMLS